jgi:homoserine O-acetyltransferase
MSGIGSAMSSIGLGRVHTQRVTLFDEGNPLVLDSGATLAPVQVAYETYGELNAARSNAVFVLHALSGDAHAAGHHGDPGQRGWWDNMIGPGRPLDTERFFVICPNLLGGCQGTTGPSSPDPRSGRAYGLRFPLFTVRDLVRVHRALLEHLGIERLHCAIGGSLGGMQALQWSLDHPEQVDRAVLACVSARLSAENIAFTAVARAAIMNDPDFCNGDYHQSTRRPDVGLAVARMMAHITYQSEWSLGERFGRARLEPGAPMTFAEDFEVERYLAYQGERFVRRFDALSYLYLTRTMDYFEPLADLDLRLAEVSTRFQLISFDTDWRFGSQHSRHLAGALARGGVEVDHTEVHSTRGHDSFLLDVPAYHELVARFVAAPAARPHPTPVGG